MPRPRNLQAAELAIEAYEEGLGEEGARSKEEGIIDLITDLLHLSDYRDLVPEAVLRMAKTNYDVEMGISARTRRRR